MTAAERVVNVLRSPIAAGEATRAAHILSVMPGFPGFGITPAGGVAAVAEIGEWTPN